MPTKTVETIWTGTVMGIDLDSVTLESSLAFASKSADMLSAFALSVATLMHGQKLGRDSVLVPFYAKQKKLGLIDGASVSGGSLSNYALAGAWLMKLPEAQRTFGVMTKARRCASVLNADLRETSGYKDSMTPAQLHEWITGAGLEAADKAEADRKVRNSKRPAAAGPAPVNPAAEQAAVATEALKTLNAKDQRAVSSVVKLATEAAPVIARLHAMRAPLESVLKDGNAAGGLSKEALNVAASLSDTLNAILKLAPLSTATPETVVKQATARRAAAAKRAAAGTPDVAVAI